jgi:hypothetical protein
MNINPNELGAECANCLDGSLCKGGESTGTIPNFWRLNSYSDNFLECLNTEACVGSIAKDENEAKSWFCKELALDDPLFCVTGFCSDKYRGNLCASCRPGFALSNEVNCIACSDNPSYYIVSVLIFLLAMAFIIFTIRNALNVKVTKPHPDEKDIETDILIRRLSMNNRSSTASRTESLRRRPSLTKKKIDYNKSSILIKILLNYLQLVSVVTQFQFRWPGNVKETLKVQARIASSLSEVFSFDCLLKQESEDELVDPEDRDASKPSTFFVKMLIISISPFIILFVSTIVWLIIFLIKYGGKITEKWAIFRSNLTTTCIILLFMVHTTIVRTCFLSFRFRFLSGSD